MKLTLIAALLAPLLASGCMMAGMSGMAGMGGMGHSSTDSTHGSTPANARGEPTVVKEVVAGGLRVTADFPARRVGDSLSYTVTLRELDGRVISTDALVFLEVSPVIMSSASASPGPTHAGHPAKTARENADGLLRTKFAPVERGGGRFVFRPAFLQAGAYRLSVLVERSGDRVIDPPLVVDHVVQLQAPATGPSGGGHAMRGGGLTPIMLLGAGFMAVMMLVAIR